MKDILVTLPTGELLDRHYDYIRDRVIEVITGNRVTMFIEDLNAVKLFCDVEGIVWASCLDKSDRMVYKINSDDYRAALDGKFIFLPDEELYKKALSRFKVKTRSDCYDDQEYDTMRFKTSLSRFKLLANALAGTYKCQMRFFYNVETSILRPYKSKHGDGFIVYTNNLTNDKETLTVGGVELNPNMTGKVIGGNR